MEPMTVRELLAATDGKLLGDISLDTTISGVETCSWPSAAKTSTGTSSSPEP